MDRETDEYVNHCILVTR